MGNQVTEDVPAAVSEESGHLLKSDEFKLIVEKLSAADMCFEIPNVVPEHSQWLVEQVVRRAEVKIDILTPSLSCGVFSHAGVWELVQARSNQNVRVRVVTGAGADTGTARELCGAGVWLWQLSKRFTGIMPTIVVADVRRYWWQARRERAVANFDDDKTSDTLVKMVDLFEAESDRVFAGRE